MVIDDSDNFDRKKQQPFLDKINNRYFRTKKLYKLFCKEFKFIQMLFKFTDVYL